MPTRPAGSGEPAIDLVGRGPEIAAITRWLDDGTPPCLVLEGEAGLGKTTVWGAAVGVVHARGGATLTSAPSEAESRLSYAGLADLLDRELAGLRPILPKPQATALAVAMRLELPGERAPDETAVARGLLEAFRQLARRRGAVLVAIDDVRLLDAPSLAALTYATRRLAPGDRVKVLVTHRAGEREPAIIDARATVARVRLGPMSLGGIHRIIRLHSGLSLARPRLLEVYAASAGNPLHALELVRAGASGGATAASSLVELFRARIAALPEASQRALLLVALSADRSIDRLERSFDGDWRQAAEPALGAGLLVASGGMARPVHPLVSQVVDEEARGAVRRAAHRALAATASTAEERAVHIGRSIAGSDADAAAQVDAAAVEARSRGARAQAATLFEEAVRLTPLDDVATRGHRTVAAAAAWFAAGDSGRVERLLTPLLSHLPAGDLRSEAQWRLGTALDEAGRWKEATALWREALAGATAPGLRAELQSSLAITAFYTESVEAANAWAASAVAEAEAGSAPGALARALAVQALSLAMRGGDHRPFIERALALEGALDEPLTEWSPSAIAAECARQSGDVAAARHHYGRVLGRARDLGDANVEQWAAFGLASADVLAGEFDEAGLLADLVLELADQTGVMLIPARSMLALVDAFRGDLGEARRLVGEAMAAARSANESTHLFGALVVLATIETCAGHPAAAADVYAEARAIATDLGLAHGTALRAFLNEAEAAAAVGRAGQAATSLAAFDRAVDGRPPAWTKPILHRARAAILSSEGRLEDASAELEAAIGSEEQQPMDLGRALLARGVLSRRLREHGRARESLTRAEALFRRLGTPPWTERAQEELGRIPGRRAGSPDGLTDAESRIAALVAQGRTNREVADALTLSVKTVEVTLTRVYDKVGVRSRSELAARMARGPVEGAALVEARSAEPPKL